MDIGSGKAYPSNALSNFAPHKFEMDGVTCASMEGFLQSLKFSNVDMQKYVCSLVGMKAKSTGKNKAWWRTQTLYWNGAEIDRHSSEYQDLLDRAYFQLAQNSSFRKALLATKGATFTHSIGKNDSSHTILTVSEFVHRLYRIRNYYENAVW
jgi:predicted NAD-dependent protein-ADP-ribosyltransferase YbiA (DUF1768 family)